MEIRAALAGNPNCGKTTMFNALTGANQYVGNWPGVTVEKKEGKVRTKESKEEKIKVTDLPGVYSLSPYTLEEVVSRDYILNEDPDVIINLVDATNIERNLYLTTQLTETGVPVVIALNMADLIRKRGMKIDKKRLSELLNCPVIETSALKKTGLKELIEETVCTVKSGEKSIPKAIFSKELEAAIRAVEELLPTWIDERKKRWYAVKLLENDRKVLENLKMSGESLKAIEKMRKAMEEKHDDDMESIVTDERYQYIQKVVSDTVQKGREKLTVSDKIDRIVTNRFLGLPIFVFVMWVVYYVSVTTVGTGMTDWTNDVFVVSIQDAVSGFLGNIGAGSLITGLVVDGIIGGLGAVLGFVPQMAVLFLLLSFLEDCGYMVRIAFVMDRVFRHFGLSGKSFTFFLFLRVWNSGDYGFKDDRAGNDRRHYDHDSYVYSMWGKASGYRAYGRSDRRRGGRICRKFLHRTAYVFYRDCGSAYFCYNIEKDEDVFRKTGSVCNGTSAVSYAAGKDSSSSCMGETERIHDQGGNDFVPCMYCYVVPWRIWIFRRKIRDCSRQCQ